MNQADTPFNPIIIPDLNLPASEPPAAPAEPKSTRRKTKPRPVQPRASRNGTLRRALHPKRSALRFARKVTREAKVSWKRVKAGITARLAHLDQAKLKKVLVACGVAAAVATAIVVVAKLTPLIVAMLALLGLGAVTQMWGRLRTLQPA